MNALLWFLVGWLGRSILVHISGHRLQRMIEDVQRDLALAQTTTSGVNKAWREVERDLQSLREDLGMR